VELWRSIREHPGSEPRPTLHRRGPSRLRAVLIRGQRRSSCIRWSANPPFNADFDGDRLAYTCPYRLEAQWEARVPD